MDSYVLPAKIIWVIPSVLAKSSIPAYPDLLLWRHEGIEAVVNLLESWYADNVLEEKEVGFHVLHSPTPDFDAPTLDRLQDIVQWIDAQIAAGRKVLVHCYAGIGRTGVVLTAYLLYKGYSLPAALAEVLNRGAAPQSPAQREALERYDLLLKNRSTRDSTQGT